MGTKISDLPRGIMADILSRLPIKPVCCCKCVCRSWYEFVELYHSKSPSLLIYVDYEFSSILELKADYNYYSDPLNIPIKLTPKFHLPIPKYLNIIGSCNGFICLLNGEPFERKHSVYISNPLLGEYFKLELPKWEKSVEPNAYGFCFSEAARQYKVLRSITREIQAGSEEVIELQVYTLGVDENWRTVGEAPYPLSYSFRDVNVNGAVHWLNNMNSERHACIYSFNIGSEKLQTVPYPPDLNNDIFVVILAKLENCLCLSDNSNYKQHVDIWWMKEYGLADSWTRHRISTEFMPRYVFKERFVPIMIWKDGEILMQSRFSPQLVSYSPIEKKFRQVFVEGCGQDATRYIPCFYSLKTIMGDNFQVSNVYPKTQIV